MHILAIDPATKCGWADSNGPSGVWDLRVRPDESSGMRLIRLWAKLNEVHNASPLELIAFEASRNSKFPKAIVVAAKIQGVLEAWVEKHDGVSLAPFSPTEIKRHSTGKGTASKSDMIDAAKKFYPDVEIESDDHADALCILNLANRLYGNCN